MSFQQRTPAEMSSVLHFYVRPSGHERAASEYIQRKLQRELPELQGVKTEQCYNVNWTGWASYWILGQSTNRQRQCPNVSLPCFPAAESFPSNKEMKKLTWLFGCPLLLDDVAQESWLRPGPTDLLLEVGPRQVFQPQAVNKLQIGQASNQKLLPLLLIISLDCRTQSPAHFLLWISTWLPTASPRAGSAGLAPRGPQPPALQPGTLTQCCWMSGWKSSACRLVRTRWLGPEPQLRRWILPTAVQLVSNLHSPPPSPPIPLASSLRFGH